MSLEDQRWRELCSQAIIQNDVNKLFNLFVELDRTTVREQRRKELLKRSLGFPPTSDLQQDPGK